MSESPRTEKELCLTRYSTPVPELDDHRYHMDAPRIEAPMDESRQTMAAQPRLRGSMTPERPDLLQAHDALHDATTIFRDFEQAVVDDDRSDKDVAVMGRRFSVDPTANFHTPQRISCNQPELVNIANMGTISRASSVSARSSSPPNSVDAFADPRRRERANTLESQKAPDLETILQLQRTISGTAPQARRPTFTNTDAARPTAGSIACEVPEEACVPAYEEPGRIPVIDYEELEEFVALNERTTSIVSHHRRHSLSSRSQAPRIFHDLRPNSKVPNVDEFKKADSADSSDTFDVSDEPEKPKVIDEKKLVETLPNINRPTRFGFFSSESQSTVHATELGDLVLPGETFRDLFELGPEGGVWWLDVVNPTEEELGAISRAFNIHPLTTEDILTQEAREKVELFKQYYFVCFRTFYQMDKTSEEFLEPVNFYMVVFRDGVLTFSFEENPHSSNVRKRIGKLRDYVSLSSDWICYAMIDDIVDSFGPVIRDVEAESEAIEDHVFIARVDDFESFLPRIGGLRKKVMSLMRLLGGKADVIRGFSKRCNEQYSVTPRGDIGLYLGDIQDHVVTMMSNLAHFEKMLSRSHTNYLAQLNVTNLVLGNHVNKVLSKVTLIATILVPMNLICGLFGMNVEVPGKNTGGLGWFFGILGVMGAIVVVSIGLARWQKLHRLVSLQHSRPTTCSRPNCALQEEVCSWCVQPPRVLDPAPNSAPRLPLSKNNSPKPACRPANATIPLLMRLQYVTLQCFLTAQVFPTVSLLFLVLGSASGSHATGTRSFTQGSESSLIGGPIISDGAGFPVALDSFNGLELRDTTGEEGDSAELDLVRRDYPSDGTSLGNNQYQNGTIEIGQILYFFVTKEVVNGNKSTGSVSGLPAHLSSRGLEYDSSNLRQELRKREGELVKRDTTVYLSMTTCSKPQSNSSTAPGSFPQLEIYYSTSGLENPGPGKDDSEQTMIEASGGFANASINASGDIFIALVAPNSTTYTGSYSYEIAASIDAPFHSVNDDDAFLYFVDADNSAALLVTDNLTQSDANSTNYKEWMSIKPPYMMFAHNVNSTALDGLQRSFCALNRLASLGRISNSTTVGMTSRGLGSKPKEQFYIQGLNRSSTYDGILAMRGNSTSWGNGIVGGGGQVWKAMNFTTKTDDNCAVLYDLDFCSEVAYAVPSNPNKSLKELSTMYDNYASKYYKNFTYSLQQVQCSADQEAMYSLSVTCDDCASAYKQWLCSVSIPRCADFTNNASYLMVRNAGQDFINGSSLPADSIYRTSAATNKSRNALIDAEIKPGPYKEILPCQDICHTLVKTCPSNLGFGCPTGKYLNSSYGYRSSSGDVTCSYPGAAYYLNVGARLGVWGSVSVVSLVWGVWCAFL
ncbi:hypothetical protein N7462_002791 [Penicillium macrosclerotiorum]|uniref:uncharacterized protein n=1 Tax=Penicillium macrosclerotiorum TaxID=303699 RepID=UPI0025481927|nr:uncharacterized protein N7462_002791 [Penicillium macrosclerotiorum]KAJ5693368.1 hypothetical protein N7462_002791 [Penicillium macrosclerotiorum]